MTASLRIAEVADRVGISTATVRYYEKPLPNTTKPLGDLSIYQGFLRWSRPASIR